MTVQYEAKAISKRGGGGSGSWPKTVRGPIKTNLTGYTIVARASFQPVGDPAPGNQSPFLGKSPTSGPKTELLINWKTAAATRNIMTNFFLGIFTLLSFFGNQSTLKYKAILSGWYFQAFIQEF